MRGTENADTLRAWSFLKDKVTVYGLEGDDTIYGGQGEDLFVGGPGNDVIHAHANRSGEGGGKKTLLWNKGDGHDTFMYYNEARKVGDGLSVLRFGSGIAPEDVEVLNGNVAVVFALVDGSGSVAVTYGNYGGGVSPAHQIDAIHFADGTMWTWSTMPRK